MSEMKVKESAQVKKARKKLKHQLSEEHKHFTHRALNGMGKSIENWIIRHSDERIILKDKSIALFDENEHSEKNKSAYVTNLLKKVRQNLRSPSKFSKRKITQI